MLPIHMLFVGAGYFVIERPLLKYYTALGGAYLGMINLQNALIDKYAPSSESDSTNKQFRHAFLILEPKEIGPSTQVRHVLYAESDNARDRWD